MSGALGTDQISAQNKDTTRRSRKPSKKLVAILLTGALVLAGGITFTAMSVAKAVAEETARQCAVALKDGARAAKASTASLAKADVALEAVKSVTLPGDEAWTSTEYAVRAGAEAIEAVEAAPAAEASQGVEAVAAVDAVEAVAARASGAEHVTSVTDAREALARIKLPTDCVERDEAASMTVLTGGAKTATKALDTSAAALLDDFAAFQVDEAVRIAAEIEAARIAAEIEAARVAAEAAAAADRAAAAQRPVVRSRSGGTYTPPRSGSGPAPRPPGGGGGVGGGGAGGYCLVGNGVGGTTYVPAPC
jgi:hypothetical protein